MLLVTNAFGALLAILAWRVSDVDVREALAWEPPADDGVERARLRHNRRIVTEDQRHGELGRLICHGLIATIGAFWILTPQPTNPAVEWWAVGIRAVAITLSCVMIEKTVHHLIARRRFDHPYLSSCYLRNFWPALQLAWADMHAQTTRRRT